MTQVYLAWPDAENGALRLAKLDGKNIVNGNYPTSPATVVTGVAIAWRTIPGGVTRELVFEFTNPPAASGYNVTVTFEGGCSKSSSQ